MTEQWKEAGRAPVKSPAEGLSTVGPSDPVYAFSRHPATREGGELAGGLMAVKCPFLRH